MYLFVWFDFLLNINIGTFLSNNLKPYNHIPIVQKYFVWFFAWVNLISMHRHLIGKYKNLSWGCLEILKKWLPSILDLIYISNLLPNRWWCLVNITFSLSLFSLSIILQKLVKIQSIHLGVGILRLLRTLHNLIHCNQPFEFSMQSVEALPTMTFGRKNEWPGIEKKSFRATMNLPLTQQPRQSAWNILLRIEKTKQTKASNTKWLSLKHFLIN